jgi:hypothetical protein
MPDLTNWVAGAAAVKSTFDTLKSAIGLLEDAKFCCRKEISAKRQSPWRWIPPQLSRRGNI